MMKRFIRTPAFRMNIASVLFVVLGLFAVSRLAAQNVLPASHRSGTSTLAGISGFPDIAAPDDSASDPKLHSPKKAAIMSACLPGLGQIYNRKYWKLGIIYPAMGGLVYGIGWNHHYFKVYRDALRIRYDDDSTTIDQFSNYSDDRIVTMKNYYQRYRDLCVIGFTAVYVLQVIDAAVDAHLFYFDVGPDLSMHWSPEMIGTRQGFVPGFSMHFQFR